MKGDKVRTTELQQAIGFVCAECGTKALYLWDSGRVEWSADGISFKVWLCEECFGKVEA